MKNLLIICLIFIGLNTINAQSIEVLDEENGFENLKFGSTLPEIADILDTDINDSLIINSVLNLKVAVLQEKGLTYYNNLTLEIKEMLLYFYNDSLFEICIKLDNPKEIYTCSMDKYGDDDCFFKTYFVNMGNVNHEKFIWESENFLFKLEKTVSLAFQDKNEDEPYSLPMVSVLTLTDKERNERFSDAFYKGFSVENARLYGVQKN